MRQALGRKKHKLCEKFGKREYSECLVRGNTPHYCAICWWKESDVDADYVNYKTGEVSPLVRKGMLILPRSDKGKLRITKERMWIVEYNKKLLNQLEMDKNVIEINEERR